MQGFARTCTPERASCTHPGTCQRTLSTPTAQVQQSHQDTSGKYLHVPHLLSRCGYAVNINGSPSFDDGRDGHAWIIRNIVVYLEAGLLLVVHVCVLHIV